MTAIEERTLRMPMNATAPSAPATTPNGRFNGRHMAAILVAFFGIVIVVNFYMAHLATSTFSGEVVENSYVASQNYNRWLDEARAEGQLGWKATARREGDGHVYVTLAGVPAGAVVAGDAWHPLGRAADHSLHFVAVPGGFRSAETVPDTRWRIRIEVKAGGHRWRTEEMVS
jgi:nitrogen fixation protein FixH